MTTAGCRWTLDYSCPDEPLGRHGHAADDGSLGYSCCCGDNLGSICSAYMASEGCDWTREYNCPGEPAGSKGQAAHDGSVGWKCCCEQQYWREMKLNVTM